MQAKSTTDTSQRVAVATHVPGTLVAADCFLPSNGKTPHTCFAVALKRSVHSNSWDGCFGLDEKWNATPIATIPATTAATAVTS